MRVIKIIPPRVYEIAGIFPADVNVPKKGEVVEFTSPANGVRFRLSKHSQTTYSLTAPLSTPRARFGNLAEITEAVGAAYMSGVLPGKPGNPKPRKATRGNQ